MKQFAGFNWPNIICTNRDQRHCPSTTINEFDLVAAMIGVADNSLAQRTGFPSSGLRG